MSYNNIGLTTPRGSGTSGHVQRNLSHIQSRDSHPRNNSGPSPYDDQPAKHRKPDASILEHDRKRRIENKCIELQLELEEQGLDDALVESKVQDLRSRLLSEDSAGHERGPLKPHETHQLAAMKAKENDKFRAAMGVKASYVEGQAFDKDLQQQRKQQSIMEREKRDAERATRLSAQKEAREQREKQQEESRKQVQKELAARREEAERRRILLDAEQQTGGRRSSNAVLNKPPSLAQRMQLDHSDHRRRPSLEDESPRRGSTRRPRSRTPSDSPPRTSGRHRPRDSRREPDVYRPSRGRSPSGSPRRSSSSRSLSHSRSRSPARRRRSNHSPSPRRRRDRLRSRSPLPRHRRRSRSPSSSHSRSRSRSRSVDSDRPKGNQSKASRYTSDTPPPPPGFRPINQQQTSAAVRAPPEAKRLSPALSSARSSSRTRTRSPPSDSDKGGSMDMSDASD